VLTILGGLVVVPDDVEQSVEDVEEQFGLRGEIIFRPDATRGFRGDDELRRQSGVPRFGQIEADHVGGSAMLEIRPVVGAHRIVIDDENIDARETGLLPRRDEIDEGRDFSTRNAEGRVFREDRDNWTLTFGAHIVKIANNLT